MKAGQYKKTLELFQQMQALQGTSPDKYTYVQIMLNACGVAYKQLKMARVLMYRSFKVGVSLMFSWAVASSTCMPNVGAWMRL